LAEVTGAQGSVTIRRLILAWVASAAAGLWRNGMRIIYSPEKGATCREISPDHLDEALNDENGITWVDLNGDSEGEVLDILAGTFQFHPLAIDDTLNETHLPKIDDWQDYLYLVLRNVVYRPEYHRVQLPELDIFLGPNYLVTYHEAQMAPLDGLWNVCEEDERLMQNGPAYLLYRLADALVSEFLAVIEQLETSVEAVESQVLSQPERTIQGTILRLKRATLQLRRVLGLQREVLNRLSRDSYAVIDEEERYYFRDVYDHLFRLYDMVDGLRDLTMGAMEVYLSVINNRTNDIMKTLTVITTLFMPLTFLTGFFGMNFFGPSVEELGAWTGYAAFLLTLLIMALVPVLMYLWMKRRRWME